MKRHLKKTGVQEILALDADGNMESINLNLSGGGSVITDKTLKGSGTIEDPLGINETERPTPDGYTEIKTIADLNNIRNNLSGKYFLKNDFDFAGSEYQSGEGWTPIGGGGNSFTGIFDGNGKTISNLFINRPSEYYQGLFGYISSSSEIKNLGMLDMNVTGGNSTGGLVGSNNGSVSNSYATGSVSGSGNVGGLVWSNSSGSVRKSYYDRNTSGQSDSDKGIPKTTDEMKQQATFVNWDFGTIWQIDEGVSYPTLRIPSSGGITISGLTFVSTNGAHFDGNGTSTNPLNLSASILNQIASGGGGGEGGLTSVSSNDTLEGNGTAESPLSVSSVITDKINTIEAKYPMFSVTDSLYDATESGTYTYYDGVSYYNVFVTKGENDVVSQIIMPNNDSNADYRYNLFTRTRLGNGTWGRLIKVLNDVDLDDVNTKNAEQDAKITALEESELKIIDANVASNSGSTAPVSINLNGELVQYPVWTPQNTPAFNCSNVKIQRVGNTVTISGFATCLVNDSLSWSSNGYTILPLDSVPSYLIGKEGSGTAYYTGFQLGTTFLYCDFNSSQLNIRIAQINTWPNQRQVGDKMYINATYLID
jgi:hypothetical protein